MIDVEKEFLKLDDLIDAGKYGPRGFKEEGDGKAKNWDLVDGLNDLPPQVLGRAKTFAYVFSRVVFLPLDSFFPECSILTENTRIPRLVCMADPERCNVGNNCLGTLLNRLGPIHREHEDWEYFVLYWRHQKGIMGLAIRAKDTNMRLMSINPYALDYFLRKADKYLVEC